MMCGLKTEWLLSGPSNIVVYSIFMLLASFNEHCFPEVLERLQVKRHGSTEETSPWASGEVWRRVQTRQRGADAVQVFTQNRLQLQTATMAAEENAGSLMDMDETKWRWCKYLRCWACSSLNGGCSLFLFDFVKIATAAKWNYRK